MTETGRTNNSSPETDALGARLSAPLAALPMPQLPEQAPAPVFPTVLRRDSAGRVWLVDRIGHRVFIHHSTGLLLAAPGGRGTDTGQFHYPADVAVSPAGRAFITDAWNHRVQVLDTAAGQFVQILGGAGRDPGRLLEPHGIVCVDGRVIVSERENHRLSMFREDGAFEQVRNRFAGLRQALTCPGAMAVAGPHLLVLAEPRRVLVLHRETWFCENCITLDPGTAPAALYPAAADLFALATLTGEVLLYGIDGTLVWTKRPGTGAAPPAPGGPAFVAMTADIQQRRVLPVRVDLPGAPLPRLIRALPQAPRHGLPAAQSFLCRAFHTLLDSAGKGNAEAAETLPAFVSRFPALRLFRDKINSHPALAADIRSRVHGQTLTLTETIALDPPPFRRAAIRCATATADGRIIAAFAPAGLAEISRSGVRVMSASEPAHCSCLAALPDGSLLALAAARGGLAVQRLDPAGALIQTLISNYPPLQTAGEPAFCLRDEISFLVINPVAGRVEVHSLDQKSGDSFQSFVPGTCETPCAVAYDAARDTVFVLQHDGRISAVAANGQILWRGAPQIPGGRHAATALAALPHGRLYAVMRPLDTGRDDYSALAELDPDTGRTLRALDVFSDTHTDEALAFEDPAPPLARGPHGLWALDRTQRLLFGFDPG